MKLESDTMYLSRKEHRWLPLFGKTGKIRMGWSYLTNQKIYTTVDKTPATGELDKLYILVGEFRVSGQR